VCIIGRGTNVVVDRDQLQRRNNVTKDLRFKYLRYLISQTMPNVRALESICSSTGDIGHRSLNVLENTLENYYSLFTIEYHDFINTHPTSFPSLVGRTIFVQTRYPSDKQLGVIENSISPPEARLWKNTYNLLCPKVKSYRDVSR
jgi:hypothetical protein